MPDAIDTLLEILWNEKAQRPNRVLKTAIEGLSNTGKSTLGETLERRTASEGSRCVSIDADKFHYGKKPAMEVYNDLIVRRQRGEGLPPDLPGKIWDYGKLERQLFGPIARFEATTAPETTITLTSVLAEKVDGTEHDESYTLDRNTTLLVPGMYLRHLPEFDFIIYLQADTETLIRRKFERSARVSFARDPSITRNMVELIEYPVMMERINRYPLRRGIVLDTTDFGNVRILSGEGIPTSWFTYPDSQRTLA